jgi:hypothetical protein
MSRSYISSPPCTSIGVLWDCFNFYLIYSCSRMLCGNVSIFSLTGNTFSIPWLQLSTFRWTILPFFTETLLDNAVTLTVFCFCFVFLRCVLLPSSPWLWRQYTTLKRRSASMIIDGAISQKAIILSTKLLRHTYRSLSYNQYTCLILNPLKPNGNYMYHLLY